ncbi:IS21 family transposase [Flexivirga caeni]|uniref:IS21 family transposase n=1 Tax=Flexivirga caeni TaxID=2294115 RepID=A0A3M9MH99_9MICO|nr:IS21 family transposase [Flexivirga caeni]
MHIDQWLRDDLDAPRKQRHTAKRVFDRLCNEHDAADARVTYSMVRAYVTTRRPQIGVEEGRAAAEVFIPQTHQPGAEAEVDFGDVTVKLAGQLTVLTLFSFRMSYSGKAVHRIFATAGQEAFLEGHVHALTVLGGVPTVHVRYDNLKAAVAQVLGFSRQRNETDRWVAFRSHYTLEAFYCQPGITGAHEKGGVEGDIGRFRRNHLVPVPEVATLAELNRLVDEADQADDDRRITGRVRTVGELFAAERPLLRPLPVEVFETGRWFTQRVDRYSQVTVRTNKYSVPTRFIGRRVRILLRASELSVFDEQSLIATHERLAGKAQARLELDHYLEAFVRKPGALPGATALEQARAAGKFTPVHDAWWAAVCKAHGDAEGTRALIAVLLLHRHMQHEHIVAGLAAALRVGALTADAVALEARIIADAEQVPGQRSPEAADRNRPDPHTTAIPTPAITSLTERRMRTALPADDRPLPNVAKYDDLLPSHRRARRPPTV